MKQKLINLKNRLIKYWNYINDNKYFIIGSMALFPIGIYLYAIMKEHNSKTEKIKRRLKHFNPTIKQGIFGEYVEWTGREKPLTDEEVEELMKS